MQVPRRTLLLLAALALAGCAAAPAGPGAKGADGAGATPSLAYGCDAARPAVAHRAGGEPVEAPAARAFPCLSRTGAWSFEPTLGVSAEGGVFFFPSMTSEGPVFPDGIAVLRSDDEGASWTRLVPGAGPAPTHVVDLDPYFYLDPATGRLFADDLTTLNCSVLSWSDDEGATWTSSLSGCMETDHQTLFAGPPRVSVTVGYPNVVYRCAMNAVALAGGSTSTTCQRSLDGGLTWLPPGAPAYVGVEPEEGRICDGATGHGVTDATGRIYLPKGLCGAPYLATSDDEGLSWTRVRVSDLGMHRSPSGYPGHDAGVGVDPEGNVYYFWIAEDRLPYLALSRDGGATWSEPRMVGAPGVREATMPALVVGGVGKLAFLYLGSTTSPGAPFPEFECEGVCVGGDEQPPGYERVTWDGYLGLTLDALADDPLFLSATVNGPADPLVRGACNAGSCQSVFDFLDVALGPDGTVWGAFVDTCVEACLTDEGVRDNAGEGVVGRLWGAPLV